MGKAKASAEFTNGFPEMIILKLLEGREMYGYEIVRGIQLVSREQFNYGEGVIYPLLHSLQRDGLLAVRKSEHNGRPRIYYRLTATGKKRLADKISHWESVVGTIQSLLYGEGHVKRTTR